MSEEISITVSVNDIMGEIAKYAILQSPYLFPKDLEKALVEFERAITSLLEKKEIPDTPGQRRYYQLDDRWDLEEVIMVAIGKCPLIVAWNEPKKGKEREFMFVSMHDGKRDPDYDFIDLHALAGNVANALYHYQLEINLMV